MKPERVIVEAAQRDREGRHGAIVHVAMSVAESGWSGHYHFRTHGMTPGEAVAKQNALIHYHAKKAARMTGFAAIVGQNVRGAAHVYEWRHCRIVEAGTDVRLEIRLRVVGTQERINISRTAGSVDGLPSNAGIASIVSDAVAQYEQQKVDADNHVRAVKAALGVKE